MWRYRSDSQTLIVDLSTICCGCPIIILRKVRIIEKFKILPGGKHHCRKQLTGSRFDKYMLSNMYEIK